MPIFAAAFTGLAQTASDPFMGRWIITDYRVRGTPTSDDIDYPTTISTDGRYYYVNSRLWRHTGPRRPYNEYLKR
jgi:hypothetical protein